MRHTPRWATAFVAVALCALETKAQSGSLADRISAVREGTVRMQFAARPGVCTDGRGNTWIHSGDNNGFGQHPCINGPIVVRIGRDDNQTVSVRKWIGDRAQSSSETDLGVVSPVDAARYLISLAHSIGGSSADEATSAAAFADGVDLAPELRALVRDTNAPLQSRRQGLFWLGQSSAPTSELIGVDESLTAPSLRQHYTFVLSQRHDDAALTKLMSMARDDRDPDIRKQAMFWLGQSKDAKALAFLRELILR